MKGLKVVISLMVVLLALILVSAAAYVVPEGRQAVITQFGRPIDPPVTRAGLHFKTPFIQEVRFVDKRILNWDGDPNQIPTKDKKYIFVDTTARWKIVDPLKFIQAVENERKAMNRLDDILDGATRNAISGHNLVEAVRNTNSIIERTAIRNAQIKEKIERGEAVGDEEEITGEIGKIGVGREKISQMIVQEAAESVKELGIELIDVQLRRIAYEREVEKKVFERMVSERKRIAEKIRSIGKGEQAKIQGKVSRDLQKIESEAYREAQEIRGKADAQAIAIYARSLSQDPKFYSFVRTMDAYKKSLKSETEFILSSDSDFLKMLKNSR